MDFICLITTHNRPSLLERAISSAMDQSIHFSKIIVIIDGQTKKYEAVIDKYEDRCFADVVAFRATGVLKGANHARNLAIKEAKLSASGDTIICFLDDDDEFLPAKTGTLKTLYESNQDLGLCYDSLEINYPDLQLAYLRIAKYEEPYTISETNFVGPTSGVSLRLRKIDIEDVFDESLSMLQDWDCWIRLILEQKLVYTPNHFVTTRYQIRTTQSASKRVNAYPTAYRKLEAKWLGHQAFRITNNKRRDAEYFSIFGWKLLHSGERYRAAGMYLKAFRILHSPIFILKAISSLFGLRASIMLATSIGSQLRQRNKI